MSEPRETPPVVTCPHCGATVAWTAASEYKPFCSERCRLIDLGDWLLEKHAISSGASADNQEHTES